MWKTQLAFPFFCLRRIFPFFLTLCNTSSFLSRSVQPISLLLQQHVPKLSKYFRSIFRSVQFSAPYQSVLQMKHFTIFFLQFELNLYKRIILFLDQPKAEQYLLWAFSRIFEHSTWWFINQPLGLKICRVFKDFSVVVITRVGTLIVATIYLQLIQNRYMFRSFTVLQCSHQHCIKPVACDVEVVGYL